MKKSYYLRLAFTGIKSNRQLYLPFLLTSTITVAMFYIIDFLSVSPIVNALKGGHNITVIMMLGSWVMTLFAVIFLFYTHSFLIRRRKKELGLYNVLGMGKRHIAKIMLIETLMLYLASIICGLTLGILLSKLSELFLVYIMNGVATFDFAVSSQSIIKAIAIFAGIFLLIFLDTLRQVGRSTAAKLLKSEQNGEKPPKANYLLGILGILLLGGAYYLACSVDNSFDALIYFFVAVLMVIVATYMLMICGSVMLCRILQKNKKYYYNPNHYVSVSLMKYRMKRGGAGLASICVLATMVLVMISSTSCLYFGAEDSMNTRYPHDIKIQLQFDTYNMFLGKPDALRDVSDEIAVKHGATLGNSIDARLVSTAGLLQGDKVILTYDPDGANVNFSELREFIFMTASDFKLALGHTIDVPDGKAVLIYDKNVYKYDSITFEGGVTFNLQDAITADTKVLDGCRNTTVETVYIIVPCYDDLREFDLDTTDDSESLFDISWYYSFDVGDGFDGDEYLNDFESAVRGECSRFYYADKQAQADDFYSTYGGLFFLGILLSIVFIIAAVLIIYYKQLSEGYEDVGRFTIMQNVGMTKQNIKKSINSQLITVFFAPLVLSGIHLAFAFPMVRLLLAMFALNNVWLFVLTNVISFVVFGICYAVVYKLTSNAYYRIVSKV